MKIQTNYNSKTRIALIVAMSIFLVASVVAVCFLSGAIPVFAATNTQTSGKFSFTDNSLTSGTLDVGIADNTVTADDGEVFNGWAKTEMLIQYDGATVHSVSSTWVKSSQNEMDGFEHIVSTASQNLSVNVISLLEQGKLQANRTYSIVCKATSFYVTGMGEGYRMFYEDTTNSATFTFTLQTVSEMPPAPTKTGYTFTGWYTDKECTHLYTEDKIIGNITLYAGFRPNNYTVHFDGNGKTSGTMVDLPMQYDTSVNLTTNAFKRKGFEFKGWSTEKDGAVVYTDGQSVGNLTIVDGDTVTLYAVWEQIIYWVHFNANGGTGSMNKQEHFVDDDKKLANNLFERVGYSFKGWATSENGPVVYTNMQLVMNIGVADQTVELYAVWEINKMTIKFYAGDGTGTIADQMIDYNTSATLTVVGNKMQREYYRFIGWATENGGEVVYKDGDTITNDNIENTTMKLYAVWERVICYVTLIVDGQLYAIVEVECGTLTNNLFAVANLSTILYDLDGDYPNA